MIAYVRSVQPTRKQFAGNQPRVAPVRDDNSIRLFAMHGRIYGPTLEFESEGRYLTNWQSIEDHVAWDVEVRRAGRYRVLLDNACDDGAAGNRFVLTIGDQSVDGTVPGTGGEDRYGRINAGKHLSAGFGRG